MIAAEDFQGTRTPGHVELFALTTEDSVTRRVVEYIERHYANHISLRDVAQAVGYSPCHLTTTFRRATGTPITAWIIKRRISAAQKLLSEANADVATACEAVGFSDICYFTRQFVRHVGVTPGRFRSATNRELVVAGVAGRSEGFSCRAVPSGKR
jgi:AraC family transcriptional activator of pobA